MTRKKRRVRRIAGPTSLRECPSCGYGDGFHVMFSLKPGAPMKHRLLVVCPMCSDVFDLGIRLDVSDGV